MNAYSLGKPLENKIIEFRRDIHMHPEISFKEIRTTKKLKDLMSQLNIRIIDTNLETGLVALLESGKPGPTVALRADIDGLPIQELNQIPYKSVFKGISHACGHDTHTACVAGAAMILASARDQIPCGNVKFLFQPCEEVNKGALMLINAGALENPKTAAIFGLHNQPYLPAGTIGLKKGTALMAAVDRIEIDIHGKGAHGGYPEHSIDPIIIAAHIITALQTIVSRNIDPQEAAVVTIGEVKAGVANNVIPDDVFMTGTVRTFTKETRIKMPQLIERIASKIAEGLGGSAILRYHHDCPLVISDDIYVDIAKNAAVKVCGSKNVLDPAPCTGGEDFAWYFEKVPGCFMWLGVGNEEKGINNPWHSSHFNIDESALLIGASTLAQCAIDTLEYLKNN